MKAGRRKIEISNEDKLLFTNPDITKGEMIDYYHDAAEYMLPHLQERPIMLQRFPNGIEHDGFYQKEASDYFPEWIETVTVEKEGGYVKHVVCNSLPALVYLVNQGTLTFHTWLSCVEALNNPDKLIIDLDPPGDEFSVVRKGAFKVKKFLDDLSVTSYLMTTGSKGVHVVVPLDGRSPFDEIRPVVNKIADLMVNMYPNIFTTERYKKNRGDKIYFDVQRNAYAQTAVCAYSLRPLPTAPVATPVDWEELKDSHFHSQTYNIQNIMQRLDDGIDPWKGIRRHAISIETLARKIRKMAVTK